jgi:hypothetical protein
MQARPSSAGRMPQLVFELSAPSETAPDRGAPSAELTPRSQLGGGPVPPPASRLYLPASPPGTSTFVCPLASTSTTCSPRSVMKAWCGMRKPAPSSNS